MARRCYICGSPEADILCSICGKFVCQDCYDEEKDCCIKCSGARAYYTRVPRLPLLVAGGLLMVAGLYTLCFAFLPGEPVVVFAFPFVYQSLPLGLALAMNLLFLGLIALVALLPLLASIWSGRVEWEWEPRYVQEDLGPASSLQETSEYIITTHVPENLRGTINIEWGEGEVALWSSRDPGFRRRYSLPENYRVEELESDFEGSYLLLRLKLVRA